MRSNFGESFTPVIPEKKIVSTSDRVKSLKFFDKSQTIDIYGENDICSDFQLYYVN